MLKIAVSGGFDPVHIGHVRMFQEARSYGDLLVVILNNDNWLMKKKGHIFMPEEERREILLALRPVDQVIITGHGPDPEDMSVCRELEQIYPYMFCNGGDRKEDNIPEYETCYGMKIMLKFNVGGGKVQSSAKTNS
jgi:D-beta-D-heptose 7-phosphate kinase/D-beta-D-heptose 1-phosphate adenosyltransferase